MGAPDTATNQNRLGVLIFSPCFLLASFLQRRFCSLIDSFSNFPYDELSSKMYCVGFV